MPNYCTSCGSKLVNPNVNACPNCGGAIRNNYNQKSGYNEIKNPVIAAVLSFLFPGSGQIYNGQIRNGIIYLILHIFLMFFSHSGFLIWLGPVPLIGLIMFPHIFLYGPVSFIALILGILIWIISIVDAYVTANKINRGEPADGFINLN